MSTQLFLKKHFQLHRVRPFILAYPLVLRNVPNNKPNKLRYNKRKIQNSGTYVKIYVVDTSFYSFFLRTFYVHNEVITRTYIILRPQQRFQY